MSRWISPSLRWNPKAGIPGLPTRAPPFLTRATRESSDTWSVVLRSARLAAGGRMPRLLVATLGRGLLGSDDLGHSWVREPGLPPSARFHALHRSGAELLAGGEGCVYRHAEGSWETMPLPAGSGSVSG